MSNKKKYEAEKRRLIKCKAKLPKSYLNEVVYENDKGFLVSNIEEGSDEDYRTSVDEDSDRGGIRVDRNGYELGFYPGKYSDP